MTFKMRCHTTEESIENSRLTPNNTFLEVTGENPSAFDQSQSFEGRVVMTLYSVQICKCRIARVYVREEIGVTEIV